jgi:hypothetical protein
MDALRVHVSERWCSSRLRSIILFQFFFVNEYCLRSQMALFTVLGGILFSVLFRLHINDMFPLGNIHCNADDSTVYGSYNGHPTSEWVEA